MKPPDVETQQCDLCVVGAGLTGLNALVVASSYLSRNQTVVLIDRRPRVGGMWVDTYPYVRLHQPHGLFTAGNVKWTLGAERSHLASKGEVLDHLEHCLDVVAGRVNLVSYFGCEFESHEELPGAVRIRARSADGKPLVIEAKRLIKASGFDVAPNDPLEISSTRVNSVSPDYCDVRAEPMRGSDTPVWVIGGGKTGMDTAYALITEYPGREVNLVAGRGTYFSTRDRFFPTGIRRWWSGDRLNGMVAAMASRYDGTNEAELQIWFRDHYTTQLTPGCDRFLFGVQSEFESTTIAAGLHRLVMDYVDDVVDNDGGTELLFRGRDPISIPPDSWVVNCSGYVLGGDKPYEPYVSAGGSVVSSQPRSAVLFLQSFQAYMLTHLMFADKLRDAPLYEMDAPAMRRASPSALPFAAMAMTQYNLSVIFDLLPTKVFTDMGLDFDRWYPFPRRMVGTVNFIRHHRRDREHHRRTLDTVHERFGVRCGPLERV